MINTPSWLATHPCPSAKSRIERLITDNALAYRNSTAVRHAVAQLGAQHKFIKPHCPWQNGKVERFNRTLQIEWAYRQVFLSNADRAAAFAPWLEFYNTRRRHTALGGLPPTSRLSPTL
jgi:transposase InsO family protein